MSSTDNKTTIKKLEKIQELINEKKAKNTFLESESDANFVNETQKIKKALGTFKTPPVFYNMPVFPLDSTYCEATKNDKERRSKTFKIALLISVVIFIIYCLTHWKFLVTIDVFCIFGTALLGYFYNCSKKEYIEKKEQYENSLKKYYETNNKFLSTLKMFEAEKEAYCINAQKFSANYAVAFEKFFNGFIKKCEEEEKAKARIEEIDKKLAKNGVIVPEYYHLLDNIITILKSGRADDYKEALNIAIRDEKEEMQRQALLAQEERRNQMLAMQLAEEQRHHQQLERQQREQEIALIEEERRKNKAMLREQQQQAFDAKMQAEKAASEARRQAERTRLAGVSKCSTCANSSHCPSHIKNNGSGLTCGSYRPYGAK